MTEMDINQEAEAALDRAMDIFRSVDGLPPLSQEAQEALHALAEAGMIQILITEEFDIPAIENLMRMMMGSLAVAYQLGVASQNPEGGFWE